MVVIRLLGDRLVAGFGGICAAVGYTTVTLVSGLPPLLTGWTLVGLAVGMIAPQVYAVAGHIGGGRVLAVVVTFGMPRSSPDPPSSDSSSTIPACITPWPSPAVPCAGIVLLAAAMPMTDGDLAPTLSRFRWPSRADPSRVRGDLRHPVAPCSEVSVDVRWITRTGVSEVPSARIRDFITRDDGILWAHMQHDDEFGMSVLIMTVAPRPEDLQEVASRNPVPRLHMYPDHHFSAINGLVRGTDGLLHLQPLKVFLTPRVLWTVFGPATQALSPEAVVRDLEIVRRQLADGDIRPETTFELIAAIRAVMVRGQEDLIATGARRVADLEGRAATGDPVTAEAVLQDLSKLAHDLQTIRINAAQTYELYDNLIDTLAVDSNVLQLDTRRLALLRQQYGHLKNSAEMERDYLREVLEMLQTRLSNELNRFVRRITAYGTIAISWTVVAGVYGMNFTNMPELNWTFGYPAAIGLMLLLTVVLWTLFRRHHWL